MVDILPSLSAYPWPPWSKFLGEELQNSIIFILTVLHVHRLPFGKQISNLSHQLLRSASSNGPQGWCRVFSLKDILTTCQVKDVITLLLCIVFLWLLRSWAWSLVCFFLICIYFVCWLVMPSAYFFLPGCSSSPFSFFFWCWATNVESWGNDSPLFMHIGPFHPDFWFPSYWLSPPPPEASFLVYPFTCIVTYVLFVTGVYFRLISIKWYYVLHLLLLLNFTQHNFTDHWCCSVWI